MIPILSSFADKKLIREKDLINLTKVSEVATLLEKFNLNIFDLKFHLKNKLELCKHECCVCGKAIHLNKQSKLTYFPTHCKSCISKDRKVRERVEATNLKKFGVKVSSQNNKVKEKAKQTCLTKYGTISPSLNSIVQSKSKETCLKKFGTEFAAQNTEIRKGLSKNSKLRDKTFREGLLKKKFAETYKRIQLKGEKQGILILSHLSDYNGKKETLYKWKCERCGKEFFHTYQNGIIPKCPNCDNTKLKGLENDLYEYLKTIFPSEVIKRNDRTIIYPYEIDFYIPHIKLAIELNGVYWHSEQKGKDKYYHLNKFLKAKEKGIKLIHVWEWEYRGQNKEITKQRFKLLLNNKNSLKDIQSLFPTFNSNIKIPIDWFNALNLNIKTKSYIKPYAVYSDGWKCENESFTKSCYKIWNCGEQIICFK